MSLIDFLLDTVSVRPLFEQIVAFPPQLLKGLDIDLIRSIDGHSMKFFHIRKKEDLSSWYHLIGDTCILFIEGPSSMTEDEARELLKEFSCNYTGKSILHFSINPSRKNPCGCALYLHTKNSL